MLTLGVCGVVVVCVCVCVCVSSRTFSLLSLPPIYIHYIVYADLCYACTLQYPKIQYK
jgi:hypothetical protein